MLPDFIIIGAMKCGTSTLAAQLAAQPGIFMTTPKEPNFFSDDEVYARGTAWYKSLFEAADPGDLKGEASTHYTKLPTYPKTLARMTDLLPDVKLIYIVREPVERAISHYIHDWTMNKVSGQIDHCLQKISEFVDYGRYSMQIAPFVKSYGHQSILLLSMEELEKNPQQVLDLVGRFLSRPGLKWRGEIATVNSSSERVRRFPLHAYIVDSRLATSLRRNFVPQRIRSYVREQRQVRSRPSLSHETRVHLQTKLEDDQRKFEALMEENRRLHCGESDVTVPAT
jgi:hypothetical protein